ncbi:oxidoreductase [Amycolatopsis rubida]|uniref:Oxidoreductase n=1 Tax=Amycolatopsis rubida TaxID=112413 RepID=A0ABX0BIG5_9PSEU|nr:MULTISPECIES: FAD-dependent oxidoreductase [Amycolatopsis]MYW90244.1 FAD-dependent oxidoreductase [Amycolatopsis rubida]NEC55221.1 oxidoreductase [Amycolatopsis rubida]OAP20113.1 Ferredoxin--NAD(P)(+) reductase fdr [Amycolatopsis sp. M39]
MSTEQLVVIGSGPAGVSAARSYREAGGTGEVRLLSADPDLPYERPPLSKDFLRGETTLDQISLADNEVCRDLDIGLVLGDPVVELGDGEVRTAAGLRRPFTQCVLATGAEPVRPDVPGTEHETVRTLRSRRSSSELRDAATDAEEAIVVGAGFIGCEAAVSLSRLGLRVTVLCPETVPQRQRLGEDAGELIANWLDAENIQLLRETSLAAIADGRHLRTDTGEELDTDLVLLATGVRPRVELAEKAGLALGQSRIRTDEHMRTSRPGIYAAGDVALAHNAAAGRALPVEHWGEGLAMGEVAGRTAAGTDAAWDAVPGFWSEIGDRTLKYAAWGDGYDRTRPVSRDSGALTVWYERDGVVVGVLTHEADEDYERGSALIREHRHPEDAR